MRSRSRSGSIEFTKKNGFESGFTEYKIYLFFYIFFFYYLLDLRAALQV
jgi:hypothetical protein